MGRRRRATGVLAASLASVAGVYIVFPAVLAVICRWRPRPIRPGHAAPATISVVIAAHDEAASIAAKLDDLAAQQLGGPPIQVIVASDGSTDGTVASARGHPSAPLVLDLPRSGKAAALNAAIAAASGEVVVFTDANSRLGPDAISALLAPFADPEVGGVAGDQRYEARPSGTAASEGRYWSYERLLKRWESCAGNVVSSTGALHAVRRELIDLVPGDVTDDFWISTGVVARGRRLVYEPTAVAWEAPNEAAAAEYRRRVRIITRGLTGVVRRRDLLDPRRHGGYAVVLAVHKVARRLVIVPMVLAAGGAWGARRGRVGRWAWRATMAWYGAAAIGVVAPRSRVGRHPAIALPAHFCAANVAAAHAVANIARSKRYVTWTPERS